MCSPVDDHAARMYAFVVIPAPPSGGAEGGRPWTFRGSELDIALHVNNAAYWEPLEEELLAREGEPSEVDVELEVRTPAQPGRVRLLRDGSHRWLTEPEGGEVYASMLLRTATTPSGSN